MNVHYRIGSLEICLLIAIGEQLVHYRIGSLEIANVLNCRKV